MTVETWTETRVICDYCKCRAKDASSWGNLVLQYPNDSCVELGEFFDVCDKCLDAISERCLSNAET